MKYIKEMNAFYKGLEQKDFLMDEMDYKMLLIALNAKGFWRSMLLFSDVIYIRRWGGNSYVISGAAPINLVYGLLDKAALYPFTDSKWEYQQIKKMIFSKNLEDKEPTYVNFLKLWQSHCKRIFRWHEAWGFTPKIILNGLIPTERIRMPRALRNAVISIYGKQCQYCGKSLDSKDIQIDHIMPVCQGGKTELKNLTVACAKCNLKKGGKTPNQANMKLMEGN